MAVLIQFVNLFVTVFQILLLIRVVMSWITPNPTSWFGNLMVELTDPILAPIRKVLPKSQLIDFSPLVAFLLLQLLSQVVNRTLANG